MQDRNGPAGHMGMLSGHFRAAAALFSMVAPWNGTTRYPQRKPPAVTTNLRLRDDAAANADTFAPSRVRPTIEATLAGIHDHRFTPDFANSRTVIQDAYLDARLDRLSKVRAGRFKTPFGIERPQSGSDISI
jgi:hypothetical protein